MQDDKRPKDFLDWLGIADSPNWWVTRFSGPALFFAFALIIVTALVAAIVVLVRTIAGGDASLGAGGLIVAILGVPFLLWTTILKHQTLRYQKEGHITDRINKAVEQLGAEKTVKIPDAKGEKSIERSEPNIEVRIGAILSLERIAQDSTKYDKGRDHVRVMEILCAYIRQNAPASAAKDHDFGEWVPLKDNPTDDERAAHLARRQERFARWSSERKVYKWAQTLPEPRADIAIALRVIGRRDAQQRLAEARWGKDARPNDTWVFDTPSPALPDGGATTTAERAAYRAELAAWEQKIDAYRGYRLDLRMTCLQRADLSELCLSGAKLRGARMEGAKLSEARMEGADLNEAWMEGADLSEARMEGTNLYEARMQGANLSEARMEGANLYEARMQGADLSEARMEGAFLYEARMEGADLNEARMEGADLSEARMDGAFLYEARMEGAFLRRARMEGAYLSGAQFDAATDWTGSSVSKARLRSVDFSNSPISMEQVKSMFGDASVTLPLGITPDHADWPAHWPKIKLRWPDFDTEYEKWFADPDTYTPPEPPP